MINRESEMRPASQLDSILVGRLCQLRKTRLSSIYFGRLNPRRKCAAAAKALKLDK